MLWLWHRLAATAPIQPLAWELPYAAGVAVKKKKKKVQAATEKQNLLKSDINQRAGNNTPSESSPIYHPEPLKVGDLREMHG